MGGTEKTFDKLFHYTVANVTRKDLKNALAVPGCGGVLVTGAHGAGKTELVRNVLHTARTDRASLTCKCEKKSDACTLGVTLYECFCMR